MMFIFYFLLAFSIAFKSNEYTLGINGINDGTELGRLKRHNFYRGVLPQLRGRRIIKTTIINIDNFNTTKGNNINDAKNNHLIKNVIDNNEGVKKVNKFLKEKQSQIMNKN